MPWYLWRGFRGPQARAYAYVRADATLRAGWTLDGPAGATPWPSKESVIQFATDHAIGTAMARHAYFPGLPPPAGPRSP